MNIKMRMAVMDGKDRARVPVTSWRLVKKLQAEVDRETGSVDGNGGHDPVPLVTWESPSPDLENTC